MGYINDFAALCMYLLVYLREQRYESNNDKDKNGFPLVQNLAARLTRQMRMWISHTCV